MRAKIFFVIATLLLLQLPAAKASVTLLDKDDWKVQMSGFVETDAIQDSTRSYTEVVGNAPADKSGTVANTYGRSQFSIRNSRLAFTILPPEQNDWKTKGYMEFDLFGYDPAPSSSNGTNTESGYYTNPTFRVRHAYLSGEKDGWQLLTGQYWTLFGWQTKYILTTVTIAPIPGYIYQRTPQVTALKTMEMGDSMKLQAGGSIARPSQRDSDMPNLDIGARLAWSGLSSGFSSYIGETSVEPLSIAITGTSRQFSTIDASTSPSGVTKSQGQAYAVDALIPVIPSSDGKDASNTLTLSGEFTNGKGYADGLGSFTGNLPVYPTTAVNANSDKTYLDAGQGGFDSSGNFSLVQLQSLSAQLQYQFASDLHLFANIGYGQTRAANVSNFTPSTGKTQYDAVSVYYINLFHDLTKQIRVAGEYDQFLTHYIDSSTALDNRYQVSAYFRF